MRARIGVLALLLPIVAGADEQVVELFEVDKLRIERPGEKVVFSVRIERFKREEIAVRGPEQFPEAWHKGERLPADVLWNRPTVVRDLALWMDGKKIEIPERFWNDLAGFQLMDGRLTPKEPTEEQQWQYAEHLSDPRLRPQVSRSAQGGTVLITWERPEE